MSGPVGQCPKLRLESARFALTRGAVTDAPGFDLEVIVTHGRLRRGMAAGSAHGGIARILRKGASRGTRRLALKATQICIPTPRRLAPLLSCHPPDPPPFTAHFPHNCTPIHAITRQRGQRAITASGSPKRVRRGRQADGEKQVAEPPYLLRCPNSALPRPHLIAGQTARFASM